MRDIISAARAFMVNVVGVEAKHTWDPTTCLSVVTSLTGATLNSITPLKGAYRGDPVHAGTGLGPTEPR
jgi:hypothetical protein